VKGELKQSDSKRRPLSSEDHIESSGFIHSSYTKVRVTRNVHRETRYISYLQFLLETIRYLIPQIQTIVDFLHQQTKLKRGNHSLFTPVINALYEGDYDALNLIHDGN
jgi:hypothetical protein